MKIFRRHAVHRPTSVRRHHHHTHLPPRRAEDVEPLKRVFVALRQNRSIDVPLKVRPLCIGGRFEQIRPIGAHAEFRIQRHVTIHEVVFDAERVTQHPALLHHGLGLRHRPHQVVGDHLDGWGPCRFTCHLHAHEVATRLQTSHGLGGRRAIFLEFHHAFRRNHGQAVERRDPEIRFFHRRTGRIGHVKSQPQRRTNRLGKRGTSSQQGRTNGKKQSHESGFECGSIGNKMHERCLRLHQQVNPQNVDRSPSRGRTNRRYASPRFRRIRGSAARSPSRCW